MLEWEAPYFRVTPRSSSSGSLIAADLRTVGTPSRVLGLLVQMLPVMSKEPGRVLVSEVAFGVDDSQDVSGVLLTVYCLERDL